MPGQKYPAGQSSVVVGVGQIFPAGQGKQSDKEVLPSYGWYVPVGHCVSDVLYFFKYFQIFHYHVLKTVNYY